MNAILPASFALALTALPAASQCLEERHRLVPRVEDSWAVELGDLDGDGLVDAVLLPGRLLLGRPDGGFVDATDRLPASLADAHHGSLLLGDVDLDGDLDLLGVGGHFVSLEDRLYLNDGTGQLIQDPTFPVSFFSQAAALGDVDGDGQPDLVLARGYAALGGIFTGIPNALFLGTSGGFVDASGNLPAESEVSYAVELVDVDLDGDLDIAQVDQLAFTFQDSRRLLLNDGQGIFSDASALLPPDGQSFSGWAFADLDGDLDPDAYVSGQPDRLYVNDGAGSFSLSSLASGHSSWAVELADLNGDGALDAVANGPRDEVLLNDGAGSFAPYLSGQLPEKGLGHTASIAVSEVDRDGDLDVLITYGGAPFERLRLYYGDGQGGLRDVTSGSAPRSEAAPLGMALGDVDGDGDPDLVCSVSLYEPGLHLARNWGTGVFADFELIEPGFSPALLDLVDLDGDGDLDLFASENTNRLLSNDGLGTFTDASASLPVGLPATVSFAAGDLNGDGLTDAFLGTDDRDGLLIADGSGGFVYDQVSLPSYPFEVRTIDVELGDLDGDGDLDLMTGSYQNVGSRRLAENQGGQFVDRTSQLPFAPFGGINDLALIDLEGDGDLDVVFGTWSISPPAVNGVWVNRGGLVFTEENHRLPPHMEFTSQVEVADLDRDGDQDLYFANGTQLAGQAPERVYLNDGAGFFTESAWIAQPLENQSRVALDDLDGDGDVDLVSFSSDGLRVLYGDEHQLSWTSLPRVGAPQSMRIAGAPGESYLLVASRYPNPTTIGFSWFGERRVVAGGVLPSSGEVSVTVPDHDPVSTLWRAVLVGRGRRVLSNPELTQRSDY